MKPRHAFPTLVTLLLFSALQPFSFSALSASATPAADAEARLAWFRDAKYGLFIHWGLYSIPAGNWHGERVPGLGEKIMRTAQIPVAEYSKLAGQFNPARFDPDAWAQLAVDAGMKYVVITAKHHEGFALFKSAASNFNVVDATPFHRDIIKELAAACARHGLRFGVYYSQALDWHEPNGSGNTWDAGFNNKKTFDEYLRVKVVPQIRELLSNYGPISIIWFDTSGNMKLSPGSAERIKDIVRSLQPDCLINGRLGTPGDYITAGDNTIPDTGSGATWETPATINHTWGFRTDDTDWKRPGEIIFNLVDIVSKGGNYLLNVGPRADGVIPARGAEHLRAVGEWLKVNGEAVYGAQRTPFGEEFGGNIENRKTPDGKPVWGALADWRCTAKPGKLYFTVFSDWFNKTFDLPPFKNKIKTAYFLNDPAKTPLKVTTNKNNGQRAVSIPRQTGGNQMANVLVVEYEGGHVEK